MIRRRRDLTDEEKTLWDQLTKKVKPLKTEKKRVPLAPSQTIAPARPSPRKKTPFLLPPEELAQNKKTLPRSTHRIRRVRKVEIQARLDLHGSTRNQAYQQLGQFLSRCQGYGYLWVLVITGKGRRNLSSEQPYDGAPPRAILRDLVPQWLEEPAFRPIVSGYSPAKPQDGGTGALYIRLKRLS